MLFFWILEKRLIAAQLQTSTLSYQKHASFYSEFIAQSDECTPSFPKIKEGNSSKFEKNSCWKMHISVISQLRVRVQVKILQRNSKLGSFMKFWFAVTSKFKMISVGSIFSGNFNFINMRIMKTNKPLINFSFWLQWRQRFWSI